MAAPSHATPPSHRMTVSSLLSPPEMKRSESFGAPLPVFGPSPLSSFNSFDAQREDKIAVLGNFLAAKAMEQPVHRDAYASPPISPYDSQSQKENMDYVDEQGSRDPQLFVPGDAAVAVAADQPLFPSQDSTDPIAEHMQSPDYARLQSKPSREDYELAVSFRSVVYEEALKNPRAWRAQERRFEAYYGRPAGVQKRQALKKLAPAPSSRPRHPKIALPRLTPRTPRVPKAKRTPQSQLLDSFDFSPASVSPKPPRPATNRDDTDYNAIPDYCPPLSTLPKGVKNTLKADWKGTALTLDEDPDRHLLHEAEIALAGTLRLNCATYLCSKRRIFQARLEALRIGKEFRKTDAQQACKIDVNKASKLWQAYDKVGWFHPDYFRDF